MKFQDILMLAATQSYGGTPAPAALISSVDARGWSGVWASGTPPTFTPNSSPVTQSFTRQGYTSAGALTSFSESLVFGRRVRDLAPNQANDTANNVAMSEDIYSGDSATGITNNATDDAPIGCLQWQQMDRALIGNTLAGSLAGGHVSGRDGKPYKCVIVTATDQHGHTATQTITAMTLGPLGRDQTRVWEWIYSLDTSAFTDGDTVTMNAVGYPRVGVAVCDSSTSPYRGFTPQTYIKNAALLAARPRVYIDAAGNDTTGVVSTNDALAAASPVLTLNGAFARARAVLGTGSGALNGLIIFGRSGTWEFTATPTVNTVTCEVTFTRDPAVSKAACIFGFGTSNFNAAIAYFRIQDCTAKRNGAFTISPQSGGKVALRDVDLDNNAKTVAFWTATIFLEGNVPIINSTSGIMNSATQTLALCRGVTFGTAGNQWAVEGYNVVGCLFHGVTMTTSLGARSFDGMVIYSNKMFGCGGGTQVINVADAANRTNIFIAQNLIEWTSATASAAIGYSRDSQTGNITGLIDANNTVAGANNAGRDNDFYDESTVPRTHQHNWMIARIGTQMNHKNGWFYYLTTAIADGRNGALAFFNGVNCRGVFTMYVDAGPNQPDFRQDFAGLGSIIGTSSTVKNDPLFVSPQCVTYNGTIYTAGAGDGDYHLQSGSPARGINPYAYLPGDLDGNARPTTGDTSGCYV